MVAAGLGLPESRAEFSRLFPDCEALAPAGRGAFMFPRLFGTVRAAPMLADTLAFARGWKPSLIVHEQGEFAAPIVAADILHGHYGRAIILTFAAGFTDVIDGYLARHFGDTTKVGAYFDPIADKIMLSLIYIALGAAGAMPWWMVAA